MNRFISEKSKESRELILNDLRIVIHAFNKFLTISDANENLELSVKNYDTFRGIFASIKKNVRFIDASDVNNLGDWNNAVEVIVRIEYFFKEYRGFINKYFYIEKSALRKLLDALSIINNRLEQTTTIDETTVFDSVQTSHTETKKIISLRELIEQDVNEHDMFLEDGFSNIDNTDYKDFVLFSFYADKEEIHLSPLNQAFGDYLSGLEEDELSSLQSHDLDSMIDDLDKSDEFEGTYAFTAVIVNDIGDGVTITTKNNRKIFLDFDSVKDHNSDEMLGEFFYKNSELEGYPYIHIEPTSAPADMAGILFLEEEISEEAVRKYFEFYKVAGYIVGVKFKDQIYRFNLGNVSDIDYHESYLITTDLFRLLKGF